METNTYLTFIWLTIAVIVIPGPSILLIVSNSMKMGIITGLFTVAGTSIAMLIQLAVAVLALTSLISFRADDLGLIRWIGIAILVYLGIKRLLDKGYTRAADADDKREHQSGFVEGFVVSLTNPTTMAFFVAFFPQFLDSAAPLMSQLLLLSVVFWLIALPVDITYALLAGRLGSTLQSAAAIRLRNRCSGAIILAAAAWLGIAKL